MTNSDKREEREELLRVENLRVAYDLGGGLFSSRA